MDRTPPKSVTIHIDHHWDDVLMQTADLHPAGSRAALLRYTVDPWPEDGGLPDTIAAALADGLTRSGLVAGRWFNDAPPSGDAQFLPAPSRAFLQRAIERINLKQPADLVTTQSPGVVVQLLDQGWWMQFQALLLLDPDGQDQAPALEALRTQQDWGSFAFAPSTWALVAPGVDGDVILIAAASGARLSELLDTLGQSFLAAGFVLPPSVSS